jgi:hypothetical protein
MTQGIGEGRERPILFSAPMVRAILVGTKTVTRRICKLPADTTDVAIDPGGSIFGPGPYIKARREPSAENDATMHPRIYCPYGYPGDRLWVRETWCLAHPDCAEDFKAAEGRPRGPENYNTGEPWFAYYAATDPDVVRSDDHMRSPWRPSIHMPRWASRITLEVVSVRVERLHDITEEDAKAEGVEPFLERFDRIGRDQRIDGDLVTEKPYRTSFVCLWDEINGDRALFASNPWVWRVEFKRSQP